MGLRQVLPGHRLRCIANGCLLSRLCHIPDPDGEQGMMGLVLVKVLKILLGQGKPYLLGGAMHRAAQKIGFALTNYRQQPERYLPVGLTTRSDQGGH